MKFLLKCLLCFSCLYMSCSADNDTPLDENTPPEDTVLDSSVYFPPLQGTTWETVSPQALGWDTDALTPLLDFLETKNTKSFMVLHNGRIAVETYMNGHSATSPWYWASAGKTLTSTVVGIAQDEGLLNINNKVSDYLGSGWTNAPLAKEDLITCENLLSMTSGIDDGNGESVAKADLNYVADAGSRWAYHNIFIKLQDVIANTSNSSWDAYFNNKLKQRIGMSGRWIKSGDFNVYWSTARSMARFGLLAASEGMWDNTRIVSASYLNTAMNASQNLNASYGYLWWLNGKSNYRLPQTQQEFDGALIPNAPDDMIAALGRNDQKIYIVPSKNIVIVRMGNAANTVNFALSNFDNELWEFLNALIP